MSFIQYLLEIVYNLRKITDNLENHESSHVFLIRIFPNLIYQKVEKQELIFHEDYFRGKLQNLQETEIIK